MTSSQELTQKIDDLKEMLSLINNDESLKIELIKAIDEYINYYNYDRLKVKLKGLSPVNYRLQSFN